MVYNLLFSYIQLNFVAGIDTMNCTTQSSEHELTSISLQFSVELTRFNVTNALYPP